MNFYAFHIGDYASATAHLSIVEDGVYRRLLDVYYTREAPIPADLRQACRLVRAQSDVERDAVEIILNEFFVSTEGGWRHARCDEEIARANEKKKKAAQSANARWGNARRRAAPNGSNSDGNATEKEGALPSDCKRNANASDQTCERIESPCEGNAPNPNPNPNPNPKIGGKPPNPQRAALPDWLDADLWADWKRHRRAIRRPMSAAAEALSLRELDRLRSDGHEPRAVIEHAILRGWQGLFPPRDGDPPARAAPSRRETTEEHNRRAAAEFMRLTTDEGTIDA